jgi:hypothetical protein
MTVLSRGTIAVVQKKARDLALSGSLKSYLVIRWTSASFKVSDTYHLPGLGI